MKFLGWLKPEYIFQPGHLVRRMTAQGADSEFTDVILPCGLSIRVRPNDSIGRALRLLGIHDLAVSETLWRLMGAGETMVDVGANIGHTAAVVASRLNGAGKIFCFEPHPEIFQELNHNVTRWHHLLPRVYFECFELALSDASGKVILAEGSAFGRNRGTARVESSRPKDNGAFYEVSAARLDDVLASVGAIGVLKLDVEGHERKVLCGARQIVEDHRVRDVVFEEHNEYPTASSEILQKCGYELYRIHKAFFGPRLLPPDAIERRSSWEPTSFLATIAPDRARRRLQARGWSILRGTDIARD